LSTNSPLALTRLPRSFKYIITGPSGVKPSMTSSLGSLSGHTVSDSGTCLIRFGCAAPAEFRPPPPSTDADFLPGGLYVDQAHPISILGRRRWAPSCGCGEHSSIRVGRAVFLPASLDDAPHWTTLHLSAPYGLVAGLLRQTADGSSLVAGLVALVALVWWLQVACLVAG